MDVQWIIEAFLSGLREMTWLEAIGVFFGISSVYFATKENIWVFPTGLISTLIYVYICLQVGLYADMGINGYYFAMSIYGWYFWSRSGSNGQVLPVTWLKRKEVFTAIGLFFLFYAVLASSLIRYTDSTVPYWDSFTTASAFVGMFLMARKKVENWIAWIITDLVSIPLYF